MVNPSYNSTEEMIKKLPELKGKTKLNFYQNIGNFFDELNIRGQSNTFQFQEDVFSKNAEPSIKIYPEVLLFMKFLQTKLQVQSMIINLFDFYYTVIKNRDVKKIVNDYTILKILLLLIITLEEKNKNEVLG